MGVLVGGDDSKEGWGAIFEVKQNLIPLQLKQCHVARRTGLAICILFFVTHFRTPKLL